MVYDNRPIRYWKERRHRKDPIIAIINISNVTVWVLLIMSLLIANEASPPSTTFFDRLLDVRVRTYWDFGILGISQWMMAGLFLLSCTGILLNTRRLKRSTDYMRVSLIITAVCSFIGSFVLMFVML